MTEPIKNIFLFVANFADGTQFFQDQTDISRIDSTKNQFFDVLEKQKQTKLISFFFIPAEGNGNTYAVDLRDGHFEVNGTPFYLHRNELGEHYKDFRLIQCRRVEHLIDRNSKELIESSIFCYILGWQTTFQGQNIQKTLKIIQ